MIGSYEHILELSTTSGRDSYYDKYYLDFSIHMTLIEVIYCRSVVYFRLLVSWDRYCCTYYIWRHILFYSLKRFTCLSESAKNSIKRKTGANMLQ